MLYRLTTLRFQLTYFALAVFSLAQCASILRDSHLGDTFEGRENALSEVIHGLKENPAFNRPAALGQINSLVEEEEKRAFNPWGGKRSFSPWGGKRSVSMEPVRRGFQPWGGKRSIPIRGGKPRQGVYTGYGGIGTKRVFQPWGGKRTTLDSLPDEMVDILKRRFSAWGGKRAQFNPWGGKRSFDSPIEGN